MVLKNTTRVSKNGQDRVVVEFYFKTNLFSIARRNIGGILNIQILEGSVRTNLR